MAKTSNIAVNPSVLPAQKPSRKLLDGLSEVVVRDQSYVVRP
jgi:hypothetical protein